MDIVGFRPHEWTMGQLGLSLYSRVSSSIDCICFCTWPVAVKRLACRHRGCNSWTGGATSAEGKMSWLSEWLKPRKVGMWVSKRLVYMVMSNNNSDKLCPKGERDSCPSGHEMKRCPKGEGFLCRPCAENFYQPNENWIGDKCRYKWVPTSSVPYSSTLYHLFLSLSFLRDVGGTMGNASTLLSAVRACHERPGLTKAWKPQIILM
ncbi:hypothetical protein PoB_006904300 [Plakobranchus ocellatus]|uniref:Uncharacterized protein n=1 Tax=Plakobranchus ocellatus TaxID=259542 RepID=A0AAV4DE76_9GAST|nr:hypothetical protein PoB_006904300 [Plakobranchus ocellatus]